MELLSLKRLACLGILLLVAACGKNPQERAPWPASITLNGLTQSEINSVSETLTGFTSTLGSAVFYFDNRPAQFQITITKFSSSTDSSSKAGLATYDESFCKVELNELVFNARFSSYLEPVLWHELGHCAGMEHNSSSGEIMYFLASPKDSYAEAAITRFMKAFTDFTSLVVK